MQHPNSTFQGYHESNWVCEGGLCAQGVSALHLAVDRSGADCHGQSAECVRTLLEYRPDVNAANHQVGLPRCTTSDHVCVHHVSQIPPQTCKQVYRHHRSALADQNGEPASAQKKGGSVKASTVLSYPLAEQIWNPAAVMIALPGCVRAHTPLLLLQGVTPLLTAVTKHAESVAKLLLEAGAHNHAVDYKVGQFKHQYVTKRLHSFFACVGEVGQCRADAC